HRVVKRLLVDRLALGLGADGAEQERIAVRRRVRDALGAGHAAGAPDVLDNHLMAQHFAHALRHHAAEHVGWSARRERNDHRHRLARIALRQRRTGDGDRERENRGRQSREHFTLLGLTAELAAVRPRSRAKAVAIARSCGARGSRVRRNIETVCAPLPLEGAHRMTRVAIAGLGTIGRVLARKLADGMPGLALACAAVRDRAKAQAWLEGEQIACPLVAPEDFPAHADLAVECAPASAFEQICRPMLEAGKRVIVLSAGALLPRPELIELAKTRGGQMIVPTGALLGLDAVTATAEGRIHSVRMITRKPPRGLAGAPYLVANGISVDGLNAAKRVFAGTAREGAVGFPENVNVAAALS